MSKELEGCLNHTSIRYKANAYDMDKMESNQIKILNEIIDTLTRELYKTHELYSKCQNSKSH